MHRRCYFLFLHLLVYSCIQVFFIGVPATASIPGFDSEPANLPDTLIIRHIDVSGNKITKRATILRELDFHEHDTLTPAQFSKKLNSGRQHVFNTGLFNFVTIDTTFIPGTESVDVHVIVDERWYIWPIPFFDISDRNFNVWWETRNLQHLSFGVDFTFFNLRGRNETLQMLVHFGFNQMYGFTYDIPYVSNKRKLGLEFGLSLELNHELPVITLDNDPVFIRNNSLYLQKTVHGFTTLFLRPDLFTTHSFRVAYSRYNFDSLVLSVPGFALSERPIQQIVALSYKFKNDHRDVQFYPLNGYCLDLELTHSIPYELARNSYLKLDLRYYTQIYSRWYWASGFTGKISFEKTQPYYLQSGLGYNRDYVRGYEYYVIDGQHYLLFKTNFKFALIQPQVKRIGIIKSSKFNTIPLALYLNAFLDMGYAYRYLDSQSDEMDTGNTLENSFLAGYGLGMDFTTYYDIVIRAEAAVNRLGKPGFYLHFIAPI
jgi:outer membrane protein assembly factor BamA